MFESFSVLPEACTQHCPSGRATQYSSCTTFGSYTLGLQMLQTQLGLMLRQFARARCIKCSCLTHPVVIMLSKIHCILGNSVSIAQVIKEQLVLEEKAQEMAAAAVSRVGGLASLLDGFRQAQRLVHAAVSGDAANLGSLEGPPLKPTASLDSVLDFQMVQSSSPSFTDFMPRITSNKSPKRRDVFTEVSRRCLMQ